MTAIQHIGVSLALVLLAMLVWRHSFPSKKVAALAAFAVFASLSLTGLFYVADQLSGNGIDQSVLFHLGIGLEGAGLADFRDVFAAAAMIVGLIGLSTWVAYRLFPTKGDTGKRGARMFMGMMALAGSFIASPASNDILTISQSVIRTDKNDLENQPEHFQQVSRIRFGPDKKNIVYLFLESVERTYLNETVFPGLMPRLSELEQQGLSFTDINQVSGTNWTISGMTAALCGLPLNGFTGNSMSGVEQFLPRATCLGDLLSEHGYDLNYIGGADLDFAGKGNFFRTHGFDLVEGRDELVPRLADTSYQSPWGLYDDSMYAFATERFDTLTASGDPFALVLLTVDTHHPNGHMSRRCADRVYGDGSNSLLNAVHCADLMLGEFVDHVRSSPAADDTILVVASDHLAMPNKAWDQLNSVGRDNLLLFFGADLPASQDDRPASTLDVGPTLLTLAGAETGAFGFGRSLVNGDPTLFESLPDLEKTLANNAGFLASLWSFPGIDEGIGIDQVNERLFLGKQTIGYPALVSVDANMQVTALQFEFFADHPLHEQIKWLPHDQRFIWIDQCVETAPMAGKGGGDPASYCAAMGMLGSAELTHLQLHNGATLSYDAIVDGLSGAVGSKQIATNRLARLKVFEKVGSEELHLYQGSAPLAGHYLIRSAGFGNGATHVTNLRQNADVELARGITVVGLNNDDAPVKLFHSDTCGWDAPIVDLENYFPSIQETLDGFAGYFSSFAVVVDDSAVCSVPVDLQQMFAQTPFRKWDQIEYRTPYIGLVLNDGSVEEFTGAPETALAIEARDFLNEDYHLPVQRQSDTLTRIAHAGGTANGVPNTNSFHALNQNSASFELFEIDFVWTSDDHLVCLHDWTSSFQTAFDVDFDGPVALSEFETLAQSARFENCTFSSLMNWLDRHPSARIVTDVKEHNVAALRYISEQYPEYATRIIPQVYQPPEYMIAKSLGFEHILWTLYRYRGDQAEVLSWLHFMDLYGLVMPISTAKTGLARRAARETGVVSLSHTINDQLLLDELRDHGIKEVMTDSLLPR